jgi:hypothetical protein
VKESILELISFQPDKSGFADLELVSLQPDLSGIAEGHIGQPFTAGRPASRLFREGRFNVLLYLALASMVDG